MGTCLIFFFYCTGDPRDLHVLTHSFPTRRSSDLGDAPPLFLLLLGALAGGLILNVMPCVFPILSLKAISLARAGESAAQARSEGIAYTAGEIGRAHV